MVLSGLFSIWWRLYGAWLLLAREVTRAPRMLIPDPAPVLPALGFRVLLYPELVAVNQLSGAASVAGYWPLRFNYGAGFIHVYGLPTTNAGWPRSNDLGYQEGPTFVGSPALQPVYGSPVPSVGGLRYEAPYTPGELNMFFWNAAADATDASPGGGPTLMFEDVEGNTAVCSPVVRMTASGTGIDDYGCASLDAELVSSDGVSSVVRLTRSHPTLTVSTQSPVNGEVMSWTDDAVACIADPADPANPNVCLVTLPGVGKYTFGVRTEYTRIEGVLVVKPYYSFVSMVVEVY